MKNRKIILAVIGILCLAVFAIAEQNKGAEKIVLNGASMGNVAFPHLQHQNALGDCNLCHDLFAKEAGVIDKMKAGKELEKKQVMNAKCIRCHKEKKNEGVKTGPTSCSVCHQK
jgi:hypothetical protein